MSQTEPVPESALTRDDQPRGLLSPAARAVLITFIVCGAIVTALVMLVGHARDKAIAEREADLREKYGVSIVVPQGSRTKTPPPWIVDGVKRDCVWGTGDLTVLCLDGDGVYTEIGNAG